MAAHFLKFATLIMLLVSKNLVIVSAHDSLLPLYSSVGPYADTSSRNLQYGPRRYGYTNDTCFLACYQQYSLFSMQHGSQCFCDNDLARATRDGAGSCGLNGGTWCNYVYSVDEILVDSDYLPAYAFESSPMDWFSANDYCHHTYRSFLASIGSDIEVSLLYMNAKVYSESEGVWVGQVDPSFYSYDFNTSSSNQSCTVYNVANDTFDDSSCFVNRSFFCNLNDQNLYTSSLTITESNDYKCLMRTVVCLPDAPCVINLQSGAKCSQFTLDASDATSLELFAGTSVMRDSSCAVICPNGGTCDITAGHFALFGVYIDGNYAESVYITDFSTWAYASAIINMTTVQHFEAAVTQGDGFRDTTVYCPDTLEDSPNCVMEATSSYAAAACTIYAKYGFQSTQLISWSSYYFYWSGLPSYMYCGHNYGKSCQIEASANPECDISTGDGSWCNLIPSTDAPTQSPILSLLSSSMRPTMIPSLFATSLPLSSYSSTTASDAGMHATNARNATTALDVVMSTSTYNATSVSDAETQMHASNTTSTIDDVIGEFNGTFGWTSESNASEINATRELPAAHPDAAQSNLLRASVRAMIALIVGYMLIF